jgi:hypothetical protein
LYKQTPAVKNLIWRRSSATPKPTPTPSVLGVALCAYN